MTDNGSTHDPADAPPSHENLKSQTSRISLESARPVIKSPFEPKKTTGLSPSVLPHTSPIPQTIRLKRPPTSPITVQPVDMPPPVKKPGETAMVQGSTVVRTAAAETVKRQTSRIGLAESAPPPGPVNAKQTTGPVMGIPMHAAPIPQTIRLKRPATSPVKRATTATVVSKPSEHVVIPHADQAPKGGQEISEAPTVIKRVVAPKTATSRIVLEEPLVPLSAAAKKRTTDIVPPAPAEPPAPKTIRLKRPSTLSDAEEAIHVAAADESSKISKKGETSKIELPIEDSSLTPITQRKTIKIKRTDRAAAPRPPPAPEAVTEPEPAVPTKTPVPEEEESVVFPIVAFAATLCIAALVYIMVAQAFGVHLLLPSSMQLH